MRPLSFISDVEWLTSNAYFLRAQIVPEGRPPDHPRRSFVMHETEAGYLTSEQMLFLSPWRPVETDTTSSEGAAWTCLNCSSDVVYFRSLARLEGSTGQFMVQCPVCDHLHVIHVDGDRPKRIRTEYGGPHIDQFLAFLDRRNEARE